MFVNPLEANSLESIPLIQGMFRSNLKKKNDESV